MFNSLCGWNSKSSDSDILFCKPGAPAGEYGFFREAMFVFAVFGAAVDSITLTSDGSPASAVFPENLKKKLQLFQNQEFFSRNLLIAIFGAKKND